MLKQATCIVAVTLLLTGCAGSTRLVAFSAEGRVWPEPPEAPRIAYVGEFSNASDLGIRPGFWGRIVSVVAGKSSEALVRPMAVAATKDNQVLFVADPDAHCVHRFDLMRGRYDCLMLSRREALASPVGLAVTSDGTLFVADSLLATIYTIEAEGKWLRALELDSDLAQPTGIAWDEERKLLNVADTGSQLIKVFRPDGTLVTEFGGRGSQAGRVNFPTYVWVDEGGELVLTDSLNFRVQRFNSRGEFISLFGENGDRVGDFARPKGVAVDSGGHVYVVDALFHALQVFSRDGALLLVFGEQGQGPGQFWLPNGIYITGDDMIFVADAYNRRVQVFRYVGTES